jgi:serine/threonine protein kinase
MKIDFSAEVYNNLENSALDLLKKMLVANPKERITASSALNHQYFDSEMGEEMIDEKLLSPCLTEAISYKDNKIKKAYYAR